MFERLFHNAVEDRLFDPGTGISPAPVLRKGGSIQRTIGQAQVEKPAIGYVELDLLDQPARSDAEQVANEEHFEQHDRIERRAAVVAAIQMGGFLADEGEVGPGIGAAI